MFLHPPLGPQLDQLPGLSHYIEGKIIVIIIVIIVKRVIIILIKVIFIVIMVVKQ